MTQVRIDTFQFVRSMIDTAAVLVAFRQLLFESPSLKYGQICLKI